MKCLNMTSELEFIMKCKEKVFAGQKISQSEARILIDVSENSLDQLSQAANSITRKFNGDFVDVETLDNAKNAKENGVKSFCLVCAWRGPSESDFGQICEIIQEVNDKVNIEVNCSLGFITEKMAIRLQNLGVKRYNHNLEASRSFFPNICTTHTYQDRIDTAKIVKKNGLELCCGGIIGMGESRMQRLEMGFDLSELSPEECPINILVPQKGTPLESQAKLSLGEILRTIAVFRFLMPRTILKIAGGREIYLANDQAKVLLGGANGIITGGYLTIGGNSPKDDLQMISQIGLEA